jgi:hypothetical protein
MTANVDMQTYLRNRTDDEVLGMMQDPLFLQGLSRKDLQEMVEEMGRRLEQRVQDMECAQSRACSCV